MTDIINVPLNKLTVWAGNVRKVQNKDGIDALAASIKAHGLQQNLVVRKDGRKFAVVAGGRRLKALQQLAKAGDIPAAFAVPCQITEADNATELSLAENVMREDNLDMKAWFTPTAENYFSRISKPQILDALKAARNQPSAPAWEKLKKAELATLAEREIAGTGWLPDILR